LRKTIWAKRFKIDGRYYCYDVGTNHIMEITQVFYDVLSYFNYTNKQAVIDRLEGVHRRQDIIEAMTTIVDYHKEKGGFVLTRKMPTRFPVEKNDYEKLLNNLLNHMILEVTENCNFRCRYCKYSGNYTYARVHSSKTMSWATLREAIDFFIDRSVYIINETEENLHFGFYGGEPILEMDKIFKATAYIENNYPETFPRCRFSITTNGSLLNKEIINELVRYGFILHVSLDGPKKINDLYRTTAGGGGTYDRVIENLAAIEKIDKPYFEEKVGFSIVLAPPFKAAEVVDFFRKRFSRNTIFLISLVDFEDTCIFDDVELNKEIRAYNSQMRMLETEYFKIKKDGGNDSVLSFIFEKPLDLIHRRPVAPLGKNMFPSGPCLPGLTRFFVDTNGQFHLCEKVNTHFPIGNLKEGFDVQRIYWLLDQYLASADHCRDCWAFRLCGECFLSAIHGNGFSPGKKRLSCRDEREHLKDHLKGYIRMLDHNPEAFSSTTVKNRQSDILSLAFQYLSKYGDL